MTARKQIPLRLPEELVARIDAWAGAEKITSRNAAIEKALDLVLPGGDAAIKRAAANGDPNAARFLQGAPPIPPGPRMPGASDAPSTKTADLTVSTPTGPTNWDGSPVDRKPYQKGGKK